MGTRAESVGPSHNFDFINHYGSDSLFTVLTHDHLAHSLTLHNNWEEIRVHDYDPILNMEVRLKSDILAAHDPKVTDRKIKTARFEARMEVRTLKGRLNLSDLVTEFDKQGLDFDEKSESSSHQIYRVGFITNNQVSPQVSLDLLGIYSEIYTIQIALPSLDTLLEDKDKFSAVSKVFFDTLEKIVNAIYKYEGKDLPPAKLEFKPKDVNSPFVAKCPYCGSGYDAHHDLNCPHCGASEPIFGSSE